MTTRRTSGKRLVAKLNGALKVSGSEWTEVEMVTLDMIESAGDRVAALKELFDAELAKDQVSTRRATEVAAEIRQLEANIQRWATTLDPEMSRTKSAAHQHAANVRWGNRGTA